MRQFVMAPWRMPRRTRAEVSINAHRRVARFAFFTACRKIRSD
jgi:hypothetical protein